MLCRVVQTRATRSGAYIRHFGDEDGMATHGSVTVFEQSKEDWTSYVERLNFYFTANDVADDGKKRAILLSACGASTYKVIRSLVDADKLNSTVYTDIVALVKNHYDPKPSSIMQRHKFNTRTRKPDESIAEYVAALREIAEHCDYKDTLSDMLRDRLVCGVNNDAIQQKLMSQKDLTYAQALEIAQMMEAAAKNTQHLKAQSTAAPSQEVHRVPAAAGRRRSARDSTKKVDSTASSRVSCHRCGGPHLATVCKFKDKMCYACNKRGHIARVCRSRGPTGGQKRSRGTHHIEHDEEDSAEDPTYTLFTVRDASAPIYKELLINNVPIRMEVDTGASVSVLTQASYQKIRECTHIEPLQQSCVRLKTYTGESISVLGQVHVKVSCGQSNYQMVAQVVEGEGPDLLGRNWLRELKVTLEGIHSLKDHNSITDVLQKHSLVFKDELGCLQGTKIKLQVNSEVPAKFYKARPVPLALKEKVEEELERLQNAGIVSPVQFSKWAAPIVPVMKRDGSVRICGDYRITANLACPVDPYPLPRVEELLANLAGGKRFSKLDLSQAYLQLPLDNESTELVTVNTHKGLFKYNRLPFGIASAPAIFQRCMESLLQGIDAVSVYIDDILVTGSSIEEHIRNLDRVLGRLESAGLRLKKSKCFFLRPRIEYLGHVIDEEGLHPTEEKVRAIEEARTPQNVTELRSFLGIINYYSRFLPNLSTSLAPLYCLLHKNARWRWSTAESKAFDTAKEALKHDSLLIHYDSSKPLILACDASQYGIGAVLSHSLGNGKERPIAYMSRTLTAAEKNYSQLEKEGLAIVFGVKKFHYYLYGRHFIIESDHKPLSYLFSESKGISVTASSRIQRWALTLNAYHYTIRYKAGDSLSNADALSRLPRPVTTTADCVPGDLIHLINHLSSTAVNAGNIREWTAKDPVLFEVLRYTLIGWPEATISEELKPFQSRSRELSTLDGCVLLGNRVIIPPQGRNAVVVELHETHPGASRMKSLARSYIWWPGMDAEIEKFVKSCITCQESRSCPPSAPLHPWQWPSQPWSRLHLDFAGPFLGHMYLVIADAHSKWLDAHIMSSITSKKTITVLRSVFAIHGLPQKVVTDNGPSFTSDEFLQFMKANGIVHITAAPYHPSTNGLAERGVQTLKQGLKRTPGETIQERLSRFLFNYRITPHSTTGIAPSELLMKRRLRSRFDLIHPKVSDRVANRQAKQKEGHDNSRPVRKFAINDEVFV